MTLGTQTLPKPDIEIRNRLDSVDGSLVGLVGVLGLSLLPELRSVGDELGLNGQHCLPGLGDEGWRLTFWSCLICEVSLCRPSEQDGLSLPCPKASSHRVGPIRPRILGSVATGRNQHHRQQDQRHCLSVHASSNVAWRVKTYPKIGRVSIGTHFLKAL